MNRGIVFAVAILGAATLIAAGCTTKKGDTIVNTPGSTTNGITVSGSGQAFGSPDIVVISLGVQAQAADVATARDAAASSAQAVIDAVKKNGVADKDIQTTQFSINPQYDFRDGRQIIRGYQVTNILSVKVRKLDTTSKILDEVAAAGGNNTVVQNINFTIDDPTKLRESARENAIKDARAKADQLASLAGVKLGKAVAISETNNFTPLPAGVVAAPRTGDSSASTPIQTGELQVNITVQVLYAID